MLVREIVFIKGLEPVVVNREHAWQAGIYGDGWFSAWSRALVCPRCLKQWAILQLAGDEDFVITPAYCEEHSPERPHWLAGVPGSLFHEEGLGIIDRPLLAVLPPALVEREFRLHINHALKEIESEIPQGI